MSAAGWAAKQSLVAQPAPHSRSATATRRVFRQEDSSKESIGNWAAWASEGRTLFERLALTREGMADAAGLAAELDEPPVVDDAVDHGGGHPVVPEHRPPPAEPQIRGDRCRPRLVGASEDPEERLRPARVEREKPEPAEHDCPAPTTLRASSSLTAIGDYPLKEPIVDRQVGPSSPAVASRDAPRQHVDRGVVGDAAALDDPERLNMNVHLIYGERSP